MSNKKTDTSSSTVEQIEGLTKALRGAAKPIFNAVMFLIPRLYVVKKPCCRCFVVCVCAPVLGCPCRSSRCERRRECLTSLLLFSSFLLVGLEPAMAQYPVHVK